MGIFISNEEIDHLCYRTSSDAHYQEMKTVFSNLGTCLVESEINGRMIATYKLNAPIKYKQFLIPMVEVPAPKKGQITTEGWEHFEIVTTLSFDEIMKLYPKAQFDLAGVHKLHNPELRVKLPSGSIKFHHQTLESVIQTELSLK
ncbi:MAG: hypothetical protein OHK0056_27340 [Bacteriovoracaceae bacterium]